MEKSQTVNPYDKNLAKYYDLLFDIWGKNYAEESEKIKNLINHFSKSEPKFLLDLGCGTGEHLKYLNKDFQIIGIDKSIQMLEIAKQKFPGNHFIQADMIDFNLNKSFDVVMLLFSAIGYVGTVNNLNKTISRISKHLNKDGIVIIEPWFSPDEFDLHKCDVLFGEKDSIKACRMREAIVNKNIALIKEHILISQFGKINYFLSQHKFGLFNSSDFKKAFEKAHLRIIYIPDFFSNRGIYIGIKNC